ncbi:MAG: hypothetical protein E3J72_10100 [Planctomycetota bacterium]|nr:MAG: hypothetical protein E3J72_10100 [Planctomycetota bacterium]
MYDYINATRQSYMHHDRWKGMPWEGDYHNNITWPSSHSWSDSLADQAQADADRLAGGGGGSPKGMPARFSQGMYIDGLGAANYQVTGLEKDGVQHDFLHKSGTARMAIHYYDPGEGPVLRQIGIGAADTGNGSTYWILLYGE